MKKKRVYRTSNGPVSVKSLKRNGAAVLSACALFLCLGLISCSSKHSNPPPAPPVPVYIDSFTATSGGQVTDTGYTPATFTFTVTAHSAAPIVSYQWSFIDDQYGNPQFVTTTTSPTAGFTYTLQDNYSVTVRVTNSTGGYADNSPPILYIVDRKPLTFQLTPTTPLEGMVPLQVDVQANAVPTSGASIVRYEWNCGNGVMFTQNTSNKQAVAPCTYTTVGPYTITAKVTDSFGYFSSSSLQASALVVINPLSMYQLDGQGDHVTFKNPYTYLADGTAGVKIFDVSDPTAPVLVGRYWNPLALPLYACSVLNKYLYCAAGTEAYIIDISNPPSPVFIATVPRTFQFATRAVATGIRGTDFLFVTDAQSGTINIFQLADFTQATFITDVTAPLDPSGIAAPIDDIFITSTTGATPTYYAYVAATTGGFAIYNVTDPTNTTMTGFTSTSTGDVFIENATGVWLTDTNYAYVDDVYNGAVLVNVSDPAHPQSLTASGTPNTTGIWATGTTVYLAASDGLYLCPVTFGSPLPSINCSVGPETLTLNEPASGVYGGIVGTDTYAFVSQKQGIDIFTTTATSLTHTSFYLSSGWGSRVSLTDLLADGFSYTALISNYYQTSYYPESYGGGVDIVGYNFTQGMQPVFLSKFTVPTDTHVVAVTDTTLEGKSMTVGAVAGGMYVYPYDLTDPGSPVPLNQNLSDLTTSSWYADPYNSGHSTASYDRIYFMDPDHIIVGDRAEAGGYSVTIPAAFITPTSYTLYGFPNLNVSIGQDICFRTSDDTIFVLGEQFGGNNVEIVAYAFGSNTPLSYLNLGPEGQSPSMACKGNYIYVGNGLSVTTVDYSNRSGPVVVASLTVPNEITAFKFVNNIGFASFNNLANHTGGFYVIDLKNPVNPALIGIMDYNTLISNPDFNFFDDDDKLFTSDIQAFQGTDGNYYVLLETTYRVIAFKIADIP